MRIRTSSVFVCSGIWLLTFVTCFGRAMGQVPGMDSKAAELLPDTTIAYVEMAPLSQVMDHPLVKHVMSSKPYKTLLRNPEVVKARGGLTLAEFALGDKVTSLLAKASERGSYLAVDAETQGVVMLMHAQDEATLNDVVTRVMNLARQQANNGSGPALKEGEYRSWKYVQSDQGVAAVMRDWLLLSNKAELAKKIVDAYLDGREANLQGNPRFTEANALVQNASASRTHQGPKHLAWAFIDIETVRRLGVAPQAFTGKADNPAAELLFGGLLAILKQTPFLSSEWTMSERSFSLSWLSPHDPSWAGAEREFFFGPNGEGEAKPLFTTSQPILSASIYRNISEMWLRAGDLFNQEVNDQISQAESGLTTLFSGRDFGEDILGAIGPELRLVVGKQDFDDSGPHPAVRLPQFAIVAQLRDPKTMQKELRRIFQSLIGFLNVVGAMNGQPPLDLDSEKESGVTYTMATYAVDADASYTDPLPIQFNFSPCLGFKDDMVILSSTVGLAKELAAADLSALDHQQHASAQSSGVVADQAKKNTILEVHSAALKAVLLENRQQIIAGNMISKGQTEEQADQEFQSLLLIADLLKKVAIVLNVGSEVALQLTVEVQD